MCQHAAKFDSYPSRRLLTVHGEIRLSRAYYYCRRCHQSYLPYDEVLGLHDEISPGLLPLVCLAGTLLPFADAAQDVLKQHPWPGNIRELRHVIERAFILSEQGREILPEHITLRKRPRPG